MDKTLRELRTNKGINQSVIADYLKVSVPEISNYENGQSLPDLEDALMLEKYFGERIEWREVLSPARKHEVIQGMIELCEHYPIKMAAEFIVRQYRQSHHPETMIVNYAKMATNEDQEPLINPNY